MKQLFLLVLFSGLFSLVHLQTVYNIKVQFDTQSIEDIINANQTIVVASQGTNNGWYSVWATFQPHFTNYLTWNSSGYYVYLSQTPMQAGYIIFPGSWSKANLGLYYPSNLGVFASGRSASWVNQDQIGTFNNDTYSYIFGLAQSMYVDSTWVTGVVSMETLLVDEHAAFPTGSPLLIFIGPKSIQPGLITDDLYAISNTAITQINFSTYTNMAVIWYPSAGKFGCADCS